MRLWTEEEQAKYLKEFAPAVVAATTVTPAPEPTKPATFMERADFAIEIDAPFVPLNPRSKAPWHGLGVNSKTTDGAKMLEWNRQNPNLNCGIVAVHELGGKWFVDDDRGTLATTVLAETGHDMSPFYRVRTSRGFHYYFEHDAASLAARFPPCQHR
jgi:hypothetical protein